MNVIMEEHITKTLIESPFSFGETIFLFAMISALTRCIVAY